ncbi:hypothetical protein [Streptomyces sp. CNQ085]|uniref:hypothetical protein n=1 Tax=Streptomyces sp. CNQ085 TaxID=2886944 RepID=UPI001F50C5C4|nr:hypothetical protein [Streptomyces sp. CNQ085]MCI0383743.1 hypothetical protein [Streptomyces sp. CNQ085]
MNELTRRRVLGAGAVLAGAVALGSPGTAPPAAAAAPGGAWTARRSANGWEILGEAVSYGIEGSGRSVRLADGDAATILLHVARRFHYEIDQLREGDVRGHRTSPRIREPYESNYLSGTAIEIRPRAYPIGAENGFYPLELVVIRDILAELDGVVAWGGDFRTPKESHFEIALGPGHPKVGGIAREIAGWNTGPGDEGAGATDAFDAERRRHARAFARRTAA